MKIIYRNNFGEELDLSDFPFMFQSENIFDYSWDYTTVDTNRRGARISSIYRNSKEFSLSVAIHAPTQYEFKKALEKFFRVTERDVLANTPGKLVVNNRVYMTGFIMASSNQYWSKGIRTDLKGIKFLSPYPWWCRNKVFIYRESEEPWLTYTWLDYPFDYAFDYFPTTINNNITNSFFGECEFEMKIFGPVNVPTVTVGSNTYQVNTNVLVNEILVINSRDKTVITYKPDGTRINELNNRVDGIFNPIPPGTLEVNKGTITELDITLFEERSEPEWSLFL